MEKAFTTTKLAATVQGTSLEIPVIHRTGGLDPVVFLHGFGSTKEDYADVIRLQQFEGRPFMAYDAPGCGQTSCSDLSKVSIPFLVETALAVLEQLKIERFHLIGHSMGGLTALMLAHRHPERVLSFVNIEGNIAPEDCFLSRQIISYPEKDGVRFFNEFVDRTFHGRDFSSALYASSLHHKVQAGAVRGIFESMVDLSDNGDLMSKFLGLPCPKMFMFGEQNSTLSYLDHIETHGVRLAKIADCGHWPMYSNPLAMWKMLADFIR